MATTIKRSELMMFLNEAMDGNFKFALLLDRLKSVNRRTYTGGRLENTAEHSWHVAMMALVFGHAAPKDVDISRAVYMLLIHDIPEISVGDTFLFDIINNEDAIKEKKIKEKDAAFDLFGMTPDAGGFLLTLWLEYEKGETPTAKFAHAIDRLQALFSHSLSNGGPLVKHGVSEDLVWNSLRPIKEGSPGLWLQTERMAESLLTTMCDVLPR